MQEFVRLYKSSWSRLARTDLAYKLLAAIALTPCLGVLSRVLFALSGDAALSDLDIIYFFLSPIGCFCLLLCGSFSLGITALEQASLLHAVAKEEAGESASAVNSLRFAFGKASPILRLTGSVFVFAALASSPFFLLGMFAYLRLLSEYDINYYLQLRPVEFSIALGIGSVLLIAASLTGLWLCTRWTLALPILLFERVRPIEALRQSSKATRGQRRYVLAWLMGWGVGTIVVSALATTLVGIIGRSITPDSTESLRTVTVAAGFTLLLWAIVSLILNLLSRTTFAAFLYCLYQEFRADQKASEVQPDFASKQERHLARLITPGRLLVAGIVGSLVSIATGLFALSSVPLADNVQVMAHRGASAIAPENTLAAFQQAIDSGADWIELDVQENGEGEVVVFHDSDLMKLGGKDLKIWDATAGDLDRIDIGSWFAEEFRDQRVPTLGQVLDECKGKIGVNIELKYYGHDQRLEERVVSLVEERGMADQVMAMSLKRDKVEKLKSLRPNWKVGLLMSVSAGNLWKLDVDFLAINSTFATRQLIRSAHQHGKVVYVWTVNDAAGMSQMISRGADGLLTDRPALARSVLKQRAAMGLAERLLLELSGVLGVRPEFGDP